MAVRTVVVGDPPAEVAGRLNRRSREWCQDLFDRDLGRRVPQAEPASTRQGRFRRPARRQPDGREAVEAAASPSTSERTYRLRRLLGLTCAAGCSDLHARGGDRRRVRLARRRGHARSSASTSTVRRRRAPRRRPGGPHPSSGGHGGRGLHSLRRSAAARPDGRRPSHAGDLDWPSWVAMGAAEDEMVKQTGSCGHLRPRPLGRERHRRKGTARKRWRRPSQRITTPGR